MEEESYPSVLQIISEASAVRRVKESEIRSLWVPIWTWTNVRFVKSIGEHGERGSI